MVDGQLYTGQPKIKGHSLKLHRKGNALLLVSAEQSEPLLEIEDFFQPLKADASSHQLDAYLVDAHSLFEAGSSDVMVATSSDTPLDEFSSSWGTPVATGKSRC